MNHRAMITPEMKVGELLDTYPDLERELIQMSPAFAKLKNPVLRRTIAKITSLRQAARVGDVPLDQMINGLREAIGQEPLLSPKTAGGSGDSPPPAWFDREAIEKELDVRPILARGEKPVATVMKGLRELSEGQIYRLTCDFFPAPLVEMAEEEGFQSWSRRQEATIEIFFCRPETSDLVELE